MSMDIDARRKARVFFEIKACAQAHRVWADINMPTQHCYDAGDLGILALSWSGLTLECHWHDRLERLEE